MDWCFRFDAISSNLDLTRSSEFEPKSQKSLTKQKKWKWREVNVSLQAQQAF